jgi:hypothetical protein
MGIIYIHKTLNTHVVSMQVIFTAATHFNPLFGSWKICQTQASLELISPLRKWHQLLLILSLIYLAQTPKLQHTPSSPWFLAYLLCFYSGQMDPLGDDMREANQDSEFNQCGIKNSTLFTKVGKCLNHQLKGSNCLIGSF